MMLILVLVETLFCVAFGIFKSLAYSEIYGDILYPSSWDLTMYDSALYTENKCYEEKPAFYAQTKEHLLITGNGSTPFYNRYEICCEGFRRSSRDWHKCEPDCSKISPNNCRHGFCRSPQNCECFEGFIKNLEGNCVQTCPISCENGHCLLDGTCICKPGYILDAKSRKFCIPDCYHIPCGLHQKCIAPGECACEKGYQWLEGLGCQPLCLPHCGHGRCVAPNKCECFAGFIKRPGKNLCEAECYINCENGFCVSRYKCQCHVGFIYDPLTSSCLPDCQGLCQHGVCIAPGICKCFEGYNLIDNNCSPICEKGCGLYGKCIAPNKCACGFGLQLCLNGSCDALGHCVCPQGMSHFIDQCLYSSILKTTIYSYIQREFYNKQLNYEFNALIGRHFRF
ncbi:nimrod B1 isoform 1-T1 [Cochliomyia hominivorax]